MLSGGNKESSNLGRGQWNSVWIAWYGNNNNNNNVSVTTNQHDPSLRYVQSNHIIPIIRYKIPLLSTNTSILNLYIPINRFCWVPEHQEFIEENKRNSNFTWKYSRNPSSSSYSLTHTISSGKWILEGEVPYPVVMLIQLLKYVHLGGVDSAVLRE